MSGRITSCTCQEDILFAKPNIIVPYGGEGGREGREGGRGGEGEGREGGGGEGEGGREEEEGGRLGARERGSEGGARAKSPIRPPTLRNITSSNVER